MYLGVSFGLNNSWCTLVSVLGWTTVEIPFCQFWAEQQLRYLGVSCGLNNSWDTLVSVVGWTTVEIPWCQFWAEQLLRYLGVSFGLNNRREANHLKLLPLPLRFALRLEGHNVSQLLPAHCATVSLIWSVTWKLPYSPFNHKEIALAFTI